MIEGLRSARAADLAEYKKNFIDLLVGAGALRFAKEGEDLTLKMGRKTTYFINVGDFNDGINTTKLARAYAALIAENYKTISERLSPEEALFLYGIPEKGVALGPVISSVLATDHQINTNWFFTRKEAKTHGEASNLSREDRAKAQIVGKMPPKGAKILLLDDVLTDGGTKYVEIEKLGALLDQPQYVGLAIGADRREVTIHGQDAVAEFAKSTNIPVYSVVNTNEILTYLDGKENADRETIGRNARYLRVYGTEEARRDPMIAAVRVPGVIRIPRSIIPACDISDLETFRRIVEQTAPIMEVGGYKIGFELGLTYGLPTIVETARKYTDKPLIYDHQKAATDIPDTARNFMAVVKKAGIDSVILFPHAGPETERAWILRALDNGLGVMVGGIMTHPAYLVSEGGFILDAKALEMYRVAARAGVVNFVVPGTKPLLIKAVKDAVEGEGVEAPIFYAPGIGTAQGGKIGNVSGALAMNWHAIVGRDITNAKDGDYRAAAQRKIDELFETKRRD